MTMNRGGLLARRSGWRRAIALSFNGAVLSLGLVLLTGAHCTVCPQGEGLYLQWETGVVHQVAVKADAVTCSDVDGVALVVRPGFRYQILATGGTITTGDIFAGNVSAAGTAGNGDANFPSPGHPRFALIFKLQGWSHWWYAGYQFPDGGFGAFEDFEVSSDSTLCLAVNDNAPADNRGEFQVQVAEQGPVLSCAAQVRFPVPGNPVPSGRSCLPAGGKCQNTNECCSNDCVGHTCGGPQQEPVPEDMVVPGTFSCSGTILNGQSCESELGNATECWRQNGEVSCPAIRDGCSCTCSLGECPAAR